MAEQDFEMALDRMFAEAPAFADADLFSLKVSDRLDRGWAFRRMVIGGLGLAGGVIGGGQLLSSNAVSLLKVASIHSNQALTQAFSWTGADSLAFGNPSVTGQVIWMSAAMALVAVGLAVTRLVREI